jgi:hypothetical protein
MLANHYAEEGGLKVVVFEVGTWTSPMTFLPTQRYPELRGGVISAIQSQQVQRHARLVGPSLSGNLEVKRWA